MDRPVAPQAPPPAVDSVLEAVGRTPLVRLPAFERAGGPRLFAKCEFLGPGNAIFDRAAVAVVDAAHEQGRVGAKSALFAAGGSDAVVSLALVASARGLPLTVVVPRSINPDRRRALRDYGAKSVAVDDALGYGGGCEKARELAAEQGGVFLDLFADPAATSGYEAIGTELVEALGRAPALTVCGLDLGAIPTGIARGLGGGELVAVEPAGARIASEDTFAPHLLGGLAPDSNPVALDRSLVRQFEPVDDRSAWQMSERLASEAGLLAGIVSGAVVVAAVRRAPRMGPEDVVVAVLPDSGERRFALADLFA